MATLNKALTRPAAIAGIPRAVRDGQRGHRPVGGLCQLLPDITAYSRLAEMKARPEPIFTISGYSGWPLNPWLVWHQ